MIINPDSPFCHLSPLQAWLTVRCWSRWSEATVCPAPRGAPSPCTRWWSSAGRKTRTKGPRSSTCSPSWRTISPPRSHNTNLEKTYSLACLPPPKKNTSSWPTGGGAEQLKNHYSLHPFLIIISFSLSATISFYPDVLLYQSWYYVSRSCVACLIFKFSSNGNMFNLAPPPCCTPHCTFKTMNYWQR